MIKCEDYCGAKDVMIMGDAKTLTKEFGLIVAGLRNKLPDELLHQIIDSENVKAFSETLARDSNKDFKTFKLRVCHLMELGGYTCGTLARALNITYQELDEIMSSGIVPDMIVVEKIADLFHVPISYLFKEHGEK